MKKKLNYNSKKVQETSTSLNTKKSDIAEYRYEDLMQALYWTWDAFDRALTGMVVIYKNAHDILDNVPLKGDKITVGIRRLEWVSGKRPILLAFTGEPEEETSAYVRFANPFNDVPVYVYFFEDDSCITSPNQVFYGSEYFMLPNPYSRFVERFGDKT